MGLIGVNWMNKGSWLGGFICCCFGGDVVLLFLKLFDPNVVLPSFLGLFVLLFFVFKSTHCFALVDLYS